MAKPGWPTTVPPGTERDTLAALVRDAHEMLSGGLTIADNMRAAYIDYVLPDGVETLIQNPLKTIRPYDITAVYATADGAATFPPLVSWSVRPSGLLSITAQYITPPPGSDPTVRLRIHAG